VPEDVLQALRRKEQQTLVSWPDVLTTLLAAYVFSRFRFKGRRGGLLALLLIMMFPATLSIIAIYSMMSDLGRVIPFLGLNTLSGYCPPPRAGGGGGGGGRGAPAQGPGVKATFRIHNHGWHPGHEGAHEHLQPGHVVGGQGQHPPSRPAEPGVGGTGGGDQGLHARAHQPPGAGGGAGCAQDDVNAGPGPQQPPQVGAELGVRRTRSCCARRGGGCR